MGLFDSLIVICPNCGKKTEIQSKVGPCVLDMFKWEDDLPVWLMASLDNTTETCDACGKIFLIKFGLKWQVTDKSLEPADNLDYVKWIEENRKKEKK